MLDDGVFNTCVDFVNIFEIATAQSFGGNELNKIGKSDDAD